MKDFRGIFKKKKKYGTIKYINKEETKDKKEKIFSKIVKSNLKIITIVLVILIVFIIFLTGYSLSKSFSEVKINSVAEVNEPIIVVDSNIVLIQYKI